MNPGVYVFAGEAQKQEIVQMQQMIKDFGARSRAIELKYEEEVQWLRRQIEEKGVPLKPRAEPTASGGLPASFAGGSLTGNITLPSLASLSGGGHAGGALDAGLPGSVSSLSGAAGRDAAEATKAFDAKGRPMDDWNVVHNPSSTTKMHIELSHTLEHDSVVCCVRFSNDGRYVATGCNKTAVLYDAATGERARPHLSHTSPTPLPHLSHTSPTPLPLLLRFYIGALRRATGERVQPHLL